MKKLLLILALCFLSPRFASAQSAPITVEATRVLYWRDIPKGLRAFVPRGGKSRFWGASW